MKRLLTVTLASVFLAVSALFADNKKNVPVVKLPLNGWTVVAAQKGWLQEEYAKYGSKVELVDQGTSKVSGAEAALLDRGDLHFASRMQYPAVIHKINGLDAVTVWQAKAENIERTQLIVLKDSTINAVEDLKGRKFASPRIGCSWSAPYETFLVKNVPLDTDLKKGEIRHVVMKSQSQIALLAGRIDTISTHPAGNTAAPLFTQKLVKTISYAQPDGAYMNYAGRTSYFAMRKFAQAHPELVKAFLVTFEKTKKWIKANPEEASVIIARELRIPKHIALFGITDASSYEYVPGNQSWENAVESIKGFQQWYKAHGDDILAKKQLTNKEIEEFVDKRFFKGGEYSIYE